MSKLGDDDMSSWYPEEREHAACDERAGVLLKAKDQWLVRAVAAELDLKDLRRDHLALHVRATEFQRDLDRARDDAATARVEAATARHWEGEARRQLASETRNHGTAWSRLQRAREALSKLDSSPCRCASEPPGGGHWELCPFGKVQAALRDALGAP